LLVFVFCCLFFLFLFVFFRACPISPVPPHAAAASPDVASAPPAGAASPDVAAHPPASPDFASKGKRMKMPMMLQGAEDADALFAQWQQRPY